MAFKIPDLGWAMSPQIIAACALVVGDVWNFNSAMCPSYMTVRTFVSKDAAMAANTKRDLVIGMTAAGVLSVGVGVAVSIVFRSWWPAAFALFGIAAADAMYLHAMQNPHGGFDDIASQ